MSEPTPMDEVINKSDDFMRIVGIAYDPSLAKQHIIEIEAQLSAARAAEQKATERAAQAEADLEKLKDPVAVRVMILRGIIARPDDLIFMHDELGPYTELKAEKEALRMDAERYRFLADSNNYEESVKLISANLTEYQLDAAIDEARGVKP